VRCWNLIFLIFRFALVKPTFSHLNTTQRTGIHSGNVFNNMITRFKSHESVVQIKFYQPKQPNIIVVFLFFLRWILHEKFFAYLFFSFRTGEFEVSVYAGYPFTTLIWVKNARGASLNYTLRVSVKNNLSFPDSCSWQGL